MKGKWRLLWSSLLLLLIRSSALLSDPNASNHGEEGSMVVVAARRGATAYLPCAITSGHPFEPPLLVLWYRDSSVTPAYSYDSRPTHNTTTAVEGRQWADERAWGGAGRAWLNTTASSAHLVIVGVHGRDEGVYRCVVHFRAAPSWSQRVALSVVDPSGYPRLQDDSGRRLEGPVGPYEEGDSVRMVCEAAGEPPPRLVWGGVAGNWKESKSLVRGRVSRTEVSFVVTRDLLHTSVTCSSFNASSFHDGDDDGSGGDGHHLFTVTALLKLNLAPLEVRLEAPGEWVTAGQVTSFRCVVVGSSPPPVFQWRLNERYLDTHTSHLQERGNVSVSTLRVMPQYTDDGEVLECRAYSPTLPSYALQHTLCLSVHFVPVVTLSAPGNKGESAAVPQGSSVTLSCHLEANPPAFSVAWFHNGRPVRQSQEGVTSNVTLRLGNVTAPDGGLYTCVGSNVEGDGQSNALHLAVLFRPVCASDSASQQYEVEEGGAVTLRCRVEALPAPLTFTWALRNATDGSLTRLLTARRGEGLTGRYTLRSVAGQLEVWCWAKNIVGTQHTPCILTVRTYRALGDLRGCSVTEHTTSGFTVACSEVVSASGVLYSLSVYTKAGEETK
ncbi:hemicentin-1-like [Portunus trituberculatus]|uniref:hemicentin-1-like n=1 Tax=Portunus trituberculatus TaxID=210409 RepID=UPI001E1CCFAD|nr:hemicentin-1-like [Portunus trituberculatus]